MPRFWHNSPPDFHSHIFQFLVTCRSYQKWDLKLHKNRIIKIKILTNKLRFFEVSSVNVFGVFDNKYWISKMQKLRKSKQLNIQLAYSPLAAQLSNFPEKATKIKTNTTGSQFWRLELGKDSVDEIHSLSGTEIGTWNDFIPFLWFGIRFLPKIWTMTTVATKWQVKQQKISIFFKNNRDSFRYDANVEIWLKSVWSRTYSTSCPDKSIFLTFGYLRRIPLLKRFNERYGQVVVARVKYLE